MLLDMLPVCIGSYCDPHPLHLVKPRVSDSRLCHAMFVLLTIHHLQLPLHHMGGSYMDSSFPDLSSSFPSVIHLLSLTL